jgi:hypothetical protein
MVEGDTDSLEGKGTIGSWVDAERGLDVVVLLGSWIQWQEEAEEDDD